ncbi:MAG: hypothetical protein ABSB58_03960 [Gemmatimonadales bacterium]|jgi:Ca2+/Na+ antiporter
MMPTAKGVLPILVFALASVAVGAVIGAFAGGLHGALWGALLVTVLLAGTAAFAAFREWLRERHPRAYDELRMLLVVLALPFVLGIGALWLDVEPGALIGLGVLLFLGYVLWLMWRFVKWLLRGARDRRSAPESLDLPPGTLSAMQPIPQRPLEERLANGAVDFPAWARHVAQYAAQRDPATASESKVDDDQSEVFPPIPSEEPVRMMRPLEEMVREGALPPTEPRESEWTPSLVPDSPESTNSPAARFAQDRSSLPRVIDTEDDRIRWEQALEKLASTDPAAFEAKVLDGICVSLRVHFRSMLQSGLRLQYGRYSREKIARVASHWATQRQAPPPAVGKAIAEYEQDLSAALRKARATEPETRFRLPRPPAGFDWHLYQGGLLQEGIESYRLWGRHMGYMTYPE